MGKQKVIRSYNEFLRSALPKTWGKLQLKKHDKELLKKKVRY